jgi:tRNA pseudouridine13 synthase
VTEILVASEEMIGLRGYLTSGEGIRGKLRSSYEDFLVEEVLSDGTRIRTGRGLTDHSSRDDPAGGYLHFVLEKRGMDIFQAIRVLSRELGVSRKRFAYSGTKDARAVTSQLVSLSGGKPEGSFPVSSRLAVRTPFHSKVPLKLGDHWGNAFDIRISRIDLEPDEVNRRASGIESEILNAGGVPNLFGHQRFGTVRANTHVVGRHLLAGDFESAVWEYLCTPFRGEGPDLVASRVELLERRDPSWGLAAFPRNLSYERTILDHLASAPRDFLGALRRLPRSLLSLFVRSYQSYIFNLTLSRRIRSGNPFLPRSGDIFECRGDRFVVGESISLDEATRLSVTSNGVVVYPVVGYATSAEGRVPAEVATTMEREGVRSSFFYVSQLPDVSPKGSWRPVVCPVRHMVLRPAQSEEGETSLRLSFQLGKGSYATVVLREFMKAGIGSY